MRSCLLTAALFTIGALSAHADSFGNEFGVGNSFFYVPGGLMTVEPINSTYVPGVGIDYVFFNYGATSNTISFTAGSNLLFSPGGTPSTIPSFTFVDQRKVDDVVALTLDPSSTLLGIVPTIGLIYYGPMYGYESTFTFDFSNVTLLPGQTATFDAVFASTQTPEPSSFLLLGTGLSALGGLFWSRRSLKQSPDLR